MLSITVIGCILVLGNALRSSLTDSSIVSRGRCQIRSQGHVIGWGNSLVQKDERCAIPLFAGLSSDEFADKNTKLDVADVTQVPSRRLFERVQRGLAKLTEIVPKPILITVVAVASGLLFFELSKTLMLLALPVIVVLGMFVLVIRCSSYLDKDVVSRIAF